MDCNEPLWASLLNNQYNGKWVFFVVAQTGGGVEERAWHWEQLGYLPEVTQPLKSYLPNRKVVFQCANHWFSGAMLVQGGYSDKLLIFQSVPGLLPPKQPKLRPYLKPEIHVLRPIMFGIYSSNVFRSLWDEQFWFCDQPYLKLDQKSLTQWIGFVNSGYMAAVRKFESFSYLQSAQLLKCFGCFWFSPLKFFDHLLLL